MTNYNFLPQYQQLLFKSEDPGWGRSRSAEKELGVLMGSKPNTSQESALAASHILGCISKSTANRSRKVIVPRYLALFRPQLEHCAPVWSP